MKYNMTTPCDACPYLKKNAHGFPLRRLYELIGEGEFHCHKTGELTEDGDYLEEGGDYVPNEKSSACAGALIFLEKRGKPNQMMRIAGRLGMYDHTKLDMKAKIR